MDMSDRALGACNPLHRLVVLLAASNGCEQIRGVARLQKIVFMLNRGEGWEDFPCGYAAGDRGPHSEIVEEGVGRPEETGVLRTEGDAISVTQLGREVAGRIAREEDLLTLAMIDEHKDMFNDLAADELLAYICTAYPGMATGSAACDRITSDKERHVMSMLKKGKITPGHASELLGLALEDVLRMTGRMRVQQAR